MPVSVIKANYFNITRRLRRALQLIDYEPTRNTVLLKPNGASAYGHYLLGDYTSPQLLEAFINLFPGRRYLIAEGSAVGMKFTDAARVNGYDAIAKKHRNVALVDLEREERVELDWKFGKIRIPRIVLESEYVNVPKMKTHNACEVTLGMKNQKGLLDERTKKKFHWMDLNEAVSELANVVQPALTLVDGIIALEGNGPNSITARPKIMGVLVAGRDMLEVDNACIRLMRIPPINVKHVPYMKVETVGVSIRNARKRFKQPDRSGGFLKFGNVYYQLGCSGCLESLSGGMRGIVAPANFPDFPRRIAAIMKNVVVGRMYLFMGRNNTFPENGGKMICIGNCTKSFAEEHGIPFISGCPPEASELAKLFDKE